MYSLLLDLPNILIILTFLVLCGYVRLIPSWLTFCLCIFAFTPFILNDVIFPASYMPDQYRYIDAVRDLRTFKHVQDDSRNVKVAAYVLAIIPLPFVETVNSLGLFNRFLMSIFVVWLYAFKKIRGVTLLVFIMYPSLLLYSSLALRDIIILCTMIVSILLYIDGKKMASIIFAFCLLFLKFQNFFIILVYMFLHEIFNDEKLFTIKKIAAFIAPLLMISIFGDELIDAVNFYRRAMFLEDGGDLYNIDSIEGVLDLFVVGLPAAFYFLTKPLLWEASNLFQIIQSFENMFAIFIIFHYLKYVYSEKKKFFAKWILFFIFSMLIYGIVVSNFGTAARYRFSFILVIIMGIYYELKIITRRSAESTLKI